MESQFFTHASGVMHQICQSLRLAQAACSSGTDVLGAVLASRSPMLPAGKGRVLVVDDEPAIRALVAKIVERAGFSVDVVADGQEPVEKVGKSDYAVIVLDLMMPAM